MPSSWATFCFMVAGSAADDRGGVDIVIAYAVKIVARDVDLHRSALCHGDVERAAGQLGEHVQSLRLGDVTGMDHPLHARFIEELNDLLNVSQIVVGVADDADLHGDACVNPRGPARCELPGRGAPPGSARRVSG